MYTMQYIPSLLGPISNPLPTSLSTYSFMESKIHNAIRNTALFDGNINNFPQVRGLFFIQSNKKTESNFTACMYQYIKDDILANRAQIQTSGGFAMMNGLEQLPNGMSFMEYLTRCGVCWMLSDYT